MGGVAKVDDASKHVDLKAKLLRVEMKTVLCDDGGRTLGMEDCPTSYQQTKTTFKGFTVVEQRCSPDGTEEEKALLREASLARITALSVQVRGESFDLLGGGHPIQDLILPRAVARLPAKAAVSLVFTSAEGEVFSVADHPIMLDTGEHSTGCCAMQ